MDTHLMLFANSKKFCDEKDPFYVYRFNDERQDGSLTYVFKCSRFQADMALSMDRNGNGLLCDQYCYANATHKRCPGFKTLTLWVYHPLLRKLVKLATMESSREDTEAFVQFWSLLNEVCPYIAVFVILNVQTDENF